MLNRIRENLDVIRILINKYGVSGLFSLVKSDVLFDHLHGVDTYSAVSKDELFTGDRHAVQNRCFPSTFGLIDLAISEARAILGEDIRNCHFLDYGCGKGKVLIGAARHGFVLSRGIECTERLHAFAVSNLKSWA